MTIDPRFMTWERWCAATYQDLTRFANNVPLPTLEARWHRWAELVTEIPKIAALGPARPQRYQDWRDWAQAFNETLRLLGLI